ncbi:flagellar protein FlaG [Dechloromonas sp. XY25]|uniref:Flagellar protein FlaG n=1 Tax=Dechloromonas hankyongensis TaxID=2908002 RepID=A0ABS9K713_9RHOO|nr:flagellar protein FlaG [Dechloromonas hankyongensis]MCG2578870.1 flagellar protein FlaG [Dechloromonas hankyongensis]
MAIQSIESSILSQQSPPSTNGKTVVGESRGTPPQQNIPAGVSKANPDTASQKSDSQKEQPTSDSLKDAVERLNKFIGGANDQIQFTVDKDTDLTVVKIIDRETKQLIRQFPSAEAVQIAKVLDRLQGLLIRDKA